MNIKHLGFETTFLLLASVLIANASAAGVCSKEDFDTIAEIRVGGGVLTLSGGEIFSDGEKIDSSGAAFYETLRGAGGSFSESDTLAAKDPAGGISLAQDASGDLFSAGFVTDAAGSQHWIVRKLGCAPERPRPTTAAASASR